MDFSASAATKDAARLRRRRFCTPTALLLDSTPQVFETSRAGRHSFERKFNGPLLERRPTPCEPFGRRVLIHCFLRQHPGSEYRSAIRIVRRTVTVHDVVAWIEEQQERAAIIEAITPITANPIINKCAAGLKNQVVGRTVRSDKGYSVGKRRYVDIIFLSDRAEIASLRVNLKPLSRYSFQTITRNRSLDFEASFQNCGLRFSFDACSVVFCEY